jgi:hypothetical protein
LDEMANKVHFSSLQDTTRIQMVNGKEWNILQAYESGTASWVRRILLD